MENSLNNLQDGQPIVTNFLLKPMHGEQGDHYFNQGLELLQSVLFGEVLRYAGVFFPVLPPGESTYSNFRESRVNVTGP